MPRYTRMAIPDEKTCYHLMTRVALDGNPFGASEKDEFVKIIKRFSSVYFTEVLGFCIMGNHDSYRSPNAAGKYNCRC